MKRIVRMKIDYLVVKASNLGGTIFRQVLRLVHPVALDHVAVDQLHVVLKQIVVHRAADEGGVQDGQPGHEQAEHDWKIGVLENVIYLTLN